MWLFRISSCIPDLSLLLYRKSSHWIGAGKGNILRFFRTIGGQCPSEYLKRILKNVKGLAEDELRDRVESHLIPYDFLMTDDFDSYFIERAKRILDIVGKAMGKPVSDRGAESTIRQFGKSLE